MWGMSPLPSAAHPPTPTPTTLASPTPGRAATIFRGLAWLAFALLCVYPLFFSLGNHPIHGDSEARYGVVARGMATGQTPLLVPTYFDQPHLTKPPLTYWLMAASIRLVGDGELALRLPAALSGVFTLAIVFGLAYRLHGPRRAAIATGILAVTPMFVVMSRMGLTDGPLGLFSTAALASGLLAAKERKQIWVMGLWISVALALLTKGPVGLLAPGALGLWLLLTGQRESWRQLRPIGGLAAALMPIVAWGLLVAWQHPEAWGIWKFQTLDRAAGTGDHPEPWWFFIPVLALGLLPATALLWSAKPRLGRWRATAANAMQQQDEAMLWAVMGTLTFIVFTAITGKLMSYLLPLAAPLAWWAAARCESINNDKTDKYKNYLRVAGVLSACAALAIAAWMIARRYGVAEALMVWPAGVLLVVVVLLGAARGFEVGPRRMPSFVVLWLAVLHAVAWAQVAEDRVYGRNSVPAAVEAVRTATGLDRPRILTVGFAERSLPYYTDRPTARIDPRVLPGTWSAMRKDDLVLLADPEAWDIFDADPHWDLAERFEKVPLELKLGYDAQPIRVYRTTSAYREP